ncbi:hypothetical protein SLEP1_g44072 [Rubroshorea leprosula]|uniref:Transposase (putative) gypsy type domain-containing protein n=1 Tax=Rubroshorea leprosula TaxID=152421 RepID=A0AAV5LF38_9ROSI|nr:hypothetical protein SLEP1_g44072 [Rubroshorea leprosula]
MIVPPTLQDVPKTMTPESSASLSARYNGGDHPTASSSSSSEETPSCEERMGDVMSNVSDRPVSEEWESKTITGRLSNLRKAPKDLPAGFRFRAALHHKVADKWTGWIPVYMDHFDAGLQFPMPGLVFDLLVDYELALTQLTPNSIRFIIGFMLLCLWLEIPAKAIVFRSLFQCWLCPNSRGAKWYYLSEREKSQLFKNAAQPAAARLSNAPSATARATVEPASASALVSAPRITYPDGFSYVKPECQPAMMQGMQSFVPPVDRQWAKSYVQQHGRQVTMIKLMDAFSYVIAMFESEQGAHSQNNELSANCKQLAAEKASLVDDVNRLQGSEMANHAAAAAKDEAARVGERASKAEAERDNALNELRSLRSQVADATRNLNTAEEALSKLKASHGRSVSMARVQRAEWLVGSAAFQDAVVVVVAVASTNMTTEIYNEIRRKVLHHRPDFPIRELALFDGEDIDEQGKSLAPLADTTVRLRWDLNEEGVPIWPPLILEEGEDPMGMPSFDGWVEGALVAEQEPSSTPPNSL